MYPSPRCSLQQDSGRSITFRLPPKPAYRSILFASRAWTIPVGAAALLTAWRPARPRLPVPTPNAWPILGTDPAPTLHNLLLREQRAWVGHFRLGRPRNDEDISAPIAVMGHTIPMHTDGVGASDYAFRNLVGQSLRCPKNSARFDSGIAAPAIISTLRDIWPATPR